MTAKATRILKEARPLFWPWCAVAVTAVLPLVHPVYWVLFMWMTGSLLGIPVLASLSFGNEFQHRTFPLLLSQPVDRMEIWREKLSVTTVAVLSAALVFSLSLVLSARHEFTVSQLFLGLDMIVIVASAPFWTLFAKSTAGGIVLNIAASSLLYLVRETVDSRLRGNGYLSPVNSASISAAALLCYAGVMLWLGWRKLARFQVTGTAAGDDLLSAGPDVMPGILSDWFRARPHGRALNLLRKEFHLLRPVWLLTLLAAAGWACLSLFGWLHGRRYSRDFETVVVSVAVVTTLMIAILAGSLSLGEEKTSGTHAWHRTLPVPALLQWSIKLAAALVAGVVGAGLVPILTFYGLTPHKLIDVILNQHWLPLAALGTFIAFWCACAADGTVAAVLWAAPVALVLGLASHFAFRWSFELMRIISAASLPLGSLKFASWVNSINGSHFRVETSLGSAEAIAVPAVLLALVQSYRLYHAQSMGSSRAVVRNLLALTVVVFVCELSFQTFTNLQWSIGWEVPTFVRATDRSIQKAVADAAKQQTKPPLQLTADDVAKSWWKTRAVPVPGRGSTLRWLTGARITVMPDKAHPEGFYCEQLHWGLGASHVCFYSATIHLADGTEIFQSIEPGPRRANAPPGMFGHSSVYVQWPDAKTREPLLLSGPRLMWWPN